MAAVAGAAQRTATDTWRPRERLCGFNQFGMFGLEDSGRTDCALEDFEGHRHDREMFALLQLFSRTKSASAPSQLLEMDKVNHPNGKDK